MSDEQLVACWSRITLELRDNLNKRMLSIHINIELYESFRRKPGWRFTAGVKFWIYFARFPNWAARLKMTLYLRWSLKNWRKMLKLIEMFGKWIWNCFLCSSCPDGNLVDGLPPEISTGAGEIGFSSVQRKSILLTKTMWIFDIVWTIYYLLAL